MKTYTKKQLKYAHLVNSSENAFLILILAIIYIPMMLCICFALFSANTDMWQILHTRLVLITFAIYIFYLMIKKSINNTIDIHFGRVLFEDKLILGVYTFDFLPLYIRDYKEINPSFHKNITLSKCFLKEYNINESVLGGKLIKINGSFFKSSYTPIEIFEFTLLNESIYDLLNDMTDKIFGNKIYKSHRPIIDVYSAFLNKVSKLYKGTRAKTTNQRYSSLYHIKNIEKHLNLNPKPFIEFILGKEYSIPLCKTFDKDGNFLREYILTDCEFAKILYFNLLEAQKFKTANITSSLEYPYKYRLFE